MKLSLIVAALAFTSAGLGSVVNLNIYTDADEPHEDPSHGQVVIAKTDKYQTTDEKLGWKFADDGHLVGLVPEARTGAVPLEVEEALFYALGPRFLNAYLKAPDEELLNTTELEALRALDGASCSKLKCAATLIRTAPCIAAAIKCKCKEPLLKCPVKPDDLCKCVGCLPKVIQDFLAKVGVCKGSSVMDDLPTLPATKDDEPALDYADYIPLSRVDLNSLAYRGDIRKGQVAEAKSLAKAGFCPTPPCGSCSCCVGVCVPFVFKCAGVCVDTVEESSSHQDL